MTLLYIHTKKSDGAPFYVGIGNKQSRPFEMGSRRSEWHNRVVKKHGVNVFIISNDLNWESACWWEIRWIKALKSLGYDLVNLTEGGDGVCATEETRQKMRASSYRRWSDPNQRELTSKATKEGMNTFEVKEKIAHMKGKKHSELTKLKMSASNKKAGQSIILRTIRSENAKAEKNPFFGKTHSVSSREKISIKLKGRVSPNKGKKFTEEHKKKLRDAWICRKARKEEI